MIRGGLSQVLFTVVVAEIVDLEGRPYALGPLPYHEAQRWRRELEAESFTVVVRAVL